MRPTSGASAAVLHGSYLPGVDGLRCLAIIAVLLFHAGLFRTGWVGVWLFFVISGFVITRTLLADAERGLSAKAMFRRFYLKRSFRILPLYLGSILVFTLAYASFEKIRASTSCSRRSDRQIPALKPDLVKMGVLHLEHPPLDQETVV